MIASGMSWQMSIGAIAAGNIFISWIMVANGTVGASLHTSFAVTARGSFGFWLSYFCVVSRLVLATVWFGVNSYSGALGLYQCFRAMWPSIATMPNHIPESQGITSNVMVAYFCYFVFQTLMAMVSPNRLRYAFLIKTIIGPATGFAMMGYYIHKSGFALYGGASTITGSTLAYLWLSSMNSSAGSYSTLSVVSRL
jgi:NCS1 family nucleobase:cation symporter-1